MRAFHNSTSLDAKAFLTGGAFESHGVICGIDFMVFAMGTDWFSIPAFFYDEIPAGLLIRKVLIELRNAHVTLHFTFTSAKCGLESKDP